MFTIGATFAFALGMAIAAIVATPEVFWVGLGFTISGTALGAAVTVWVIQAMMNTLQQKKDREQRVKLLSDI